MTGPPEPRSRSQLCRMEATGALTPDEAWAEVVRLGQEIDPEILEEDEAGCE